MLRMLFLHGWATDHRIWTRQAAALAGQAHIDCPDWPTWDHTWLAAHLTRSPESLTVVIGWSLGAMLTLEACARSGYAPRALVLLAPCASFCRRPDFGLGVAPALVRGMRQRLRRDPEQVCRNFYDQLLAPGEKNAIQELQELLPDSCAPGWLAAGLDYLQHRDLRPLLPQVRAGRIILLHGDRDAIIAPAQSYFLQDQLPQAVLHLLPGAGHVPFLTQADTVNQILTGLL